MKPPALREHPLIKAAVSALFATIIAIFLYATDTSGQSCPTPPDVPTGGGQSIEASLLRTSNQCSATSGMFVKKGTPFTVHARATADGSCQARGNDCSTLPCTCVNIGAPQQRTIANIQMWQTIAAPPLQGDYFSPGAVYGIVPGTSTLAYYQVLDTHNSNSTGPKSWTPLYSGEYVLKVGGNINKTLCNIEPGATPITEIAIHARSALHKGTPCNGSLDGGGQLGETAGTGYTHYHGSDPPTFQDTWGDTDYIVKTIKDVATQWNGLHAMPRINVGDISKSGGGAMSGHSCHQNGLEADIRYVRNDGTEGPLDLSTDSTLYSKTLTVELMQLFVATGLVDLIYVHPDSDIAASDVAGVVQDSSATHINHFHVRLMDPDGADSNNC